MVSHSAAFIPCPYLPRPSRSAARLCCSWDPGREQNPIFDEGDGLLGPNAAQSSQTQSSPPTPPFFPLLSSVHFSLPTIFSLGDATNSFKLSHRLTSWEPLSDSALLSSNPSFLLILLILLSGQCRNLGLVSRALKGAPSSSIPLWPCGVCSVETTKFHCCYCTTR